MTYLGQQGFVGITDPLVLCQRYGSLVISNASVINGSVVVSMLNGTTIPELCNKTTQEIQVISAHLPHPNHCILKSISFIIYSGLQEISGYDIVRNEQSILIMLRAMRYYA